ncbi:MAG: DUF1127 domain-containing protein [Gemmobacter sp.]|nr:DUF1127 domain-containing protein [Gemmobacter sp.]
MAYTTTDRIAHPGFAHRIQTMIETFHTMLARRAIYRQTLRELDALPQRELADLGIERSMITQLAHEAAYGK